MKKFGFFLVSAVFLSLAASPASAVSCPTHSENSLTGASACALGSINNDKLNPTLQVNDDMMFGFSDWSYDAKDEGANGVDDGTNSLDLALTGGTTAGGSDGANTGVLGGTWSIVANAFSLYENIMLVFKDGNGDPDTYVGYLLNATSGNYQSPFLNGTNLKGISHVSIYHRGTASTIPLPAGILLLLSGIGGLVFIGRRRQTLA